MDENCNERLRKMGSKFYDYDIREDGMVRCPVCGEYTFDEPDDYTYCDNCGWFNSDSMLNIDGFSGPLYMTFEEAQKAYAEGRPIE